MLETVRSRRRFGAAVVVLLPLCVAGGYYLRVQRDDDLIKTASNLVASSPGPSAAPVTKPTPLTPAQHLALLRESAAVQERLEMLDLKRAKLDTDVEDLGRKLERARSGQRDPRLAMGSQDAKEAQGTGR